jgi:hypothetical protein
MLVKQVERRQIRRTGEMSCPENGEYPPLPVLEVNGADVLVQLFEISRRY